MRGIGRERRMRGIIGLAGSGYLYISSLPSGKSGRLRRSGRSHRLDPDGI